MFLSHLIYRQVSIMLFEVATKGNFFTLLEQAPFTFTDIFYRISPVNFNHSIIVQLNN